MNGSILVADDEGPARKHIASFLEQEGYRVSEVGDGQAAIEAIDQSEFDLILTDLKMARADGIAVLKHVREVSPASFVIIMTAFASVDSAVEALRLGAQDFFIKPVNFEEISRKLKHLTEYRSLAWEIQMLRRAVSHGIHDSNLVGHSGALKEILALIEKVAPTFSTVIVSGESGVGKEVVARAIHKQSPRKDKIFLPVNCSAIPETLLESQLFGYVRGAFTGAVNSQEGLFQRARGGTLFLDEIGELPQSLQPKLLRAIEEKEVLPVGSTQPVQTDIRVIASTNRDLKEETEKGHFREDLYYRLNVIHMHIPPLRERREDIPLLVDYLIQRHNRELKRAYKGADNAAMKVLMSLPWKGNIRELDNVLERAMILGNAEWITTGDLPHDNNLEETGSNGHAAGQRLRDALKAYEKSHIESVLKQASGDRTHAAEILGLSRSSLYRKIDSLGIDL